MTLINFAFSFSALKHYFLPALINTGRAICGYSWGQLYARDFGNADIFRRGRAPLRGFSMQTLFEMMLQYNTGSSLAYFLAALHWTRCSWLITPFLLVFTFLLKALPRKNASGGDLEIFRLFLKPDSWLLKFPTIENPWIVKILNFFERNLLMLSLGITIFTYLGLLLIGQVVFALSALSTLIFAYFRYKGKNSASFERLFVKYAVWIQILLIVAAANWLGYLLLATSFLAQYALSYHTVQRFVIKKLFGEKVASLLDKKDPPLTPFEFHCAIQDLPQRLNELTAQSVDIVRAHVKQGNALLPPSLPDDIQFDLLLTIFAKLNWQASGVRELVEKNRYSDWRLKKEEEGNAQPTLDGDKEQLYEQDRKCLQQNLQKFIDYLNAPANEINTSASSEEVKPSNEGFFSRYIKMILTPMTLIQERVKRSLPSTWAEQATQTHVNQDTKAANPFQESLARRYAKAALLIMTSMLDKASKNSDNKLKEELVNTVLDKIIFLGFETGDYCSLGKNRAIEECYLSLLSFKSELSLKERLQRIHQLAREHFFQMVYVRDKYYRYFGQANDAHVYAQAVATWGGNLGLPPVYGEESIISIFANIILPMTPLEAEFWDTISIDKLMEQLAANMNSPLLPIKVIDRWYKEFIDQHTDGSDEEKEAHLATYQPYTVEYHGPEPIYKLKPEINFLIHLDCGVLYLTEQTCKETAQSNNIPVKNAKKVSKKVNFAPSFTPSYASTQPINLILESSVAMASPTTVNKVRIG